MGFDVSAPSAYVEERAGEILSRAVLGAKVSAMMNRVTGVKSSIKLPTIDHGYDILKADANCTFTDSGNDLVIAQRTIDPIDMKVQEKYCIKDLEPIFTQKYLTPGSEYSDVPGELRLMEMITERISKVIELAVVRGVAGGSSQVASFNIFDGIIETISNDIAAASIPAAQQLTGALTATNIIASFRAMYDQLPIDNRLNTSEDGDWVIMCSPRAKDIYNRDYQSTNGALPYNNNFNQDFLDSTGIEIVAYAGFQGDDSQAVLTRKSNWFMGVDLDGEETNLSLTQGTGSEQDDLFLSVKFKMGINNMFPDEMVVNNIS